jgi:hypothetical protein
LNSFSDDIKNFLVPVPGDANPVTKLPDEFAYQMDIGVSEEKRK